MNREYKLKIYKEANERAKKRMDAENERIAKNKLFDFAGKCVITGFNLHEFHRNTQAKCTHSK